MRYGGLIAAVVVAALAAIIVLRMSNANQPAPTTGAPPVAEMKTTPIYVAAKAIPVGATVTADMITSQPWPQQLVLPGFVAADGKTNLVGLVARAPFQQNEPVINSKLANPNDPNFLAGDLPKGMRVVTIPVNETDGVAGFIFPGDHVDLIYTHDVDKWEMPPGSNTGANAANPSAQLQKTKVTFTDTLLTNVKVLAIDQRASGDGATDKDGKLMVPRSASLMVSQADSQRVKLAQKTGTISLVLRALADKETADPLMLTAPKDISQAASGDTGAVPGMDDAGIKIVRGAPKSDKETAQSGAGISRGAASATGTAPGFGAPVNGSNIVTPGLVAVP